MVEVGQQVTFDATPAGAGVGGNLQYRWDFDGDGRWDHPAGDDAWSSQAVVQHTYEAARDYRVIVRVRDPRWHTQNQRVETIVVADPGASSVEAALMLLAAILALPLFGALVVALMPRKEERACRHMGLVFTLLTFFASCGLAAFNYKLGRAATRAGRALDQCPGHQLSPGCRWAEPLAGAVDDVPGAGGAAQQLLGSHRAGQGFRRGHAGARGRDDRRLCVPRPVPVLRVLGADARAHVPIDRGVGTRRQDLRGDQVRALYRCGLAADAGAPWSTST